MYIYEFDLHVFYCIRSSKKIAKLIEEKLILHPSQIVSHSKNLRESKHFHV